MVTLMTEFGRRLWLLKTSVAKHMHIISPCQTSVTGRRLSTIYKQGHKFKHGIAYMNSYYITHLIVITDGNNILDTPLVKHYNDFYVIHKVWNFFPEISEKIFS